MASTSTLDRVTTKLFDNIEKLKSDGSNWDIWKSQVTLVLRHQKLLPLSQLATGCVTCHTSRGCVTHFRPILGNLVEVTLVTSPFMYIVSHAKGRKFP